MSRTKIKDEIRLSRTITIRVTEEDFERLNQIALDLTIKLKKRITGQDVIRIFLSKYKISGYNRILGFHE